MAAHKEPGEVQGDHPQQDPKVSTRRDGADHPRHQSHAHRLVWILQTQSLDHVQAIGPVDTAETAKHPAQKAQGKRACPRERSSAMAKCVLRRIRANLLSLSPDPSGQLSMRPPTGKPDAGKPPVRFGGRGKVYPLFLPLSIPTGLHHSAQQRCLVCKDFF